MGSLLQSTLNTRALPTGDLRYGCVEIMIFEQNLDEVKDDKLIIS